MNEDSQNINPQQPVQPVQESTPPAEPVSTQTPTTEPTSPQPTPEPPKQKNKFKVLLIVFLAIIILGLLGYIAYQKYIIKEPVPKSTPQPSPTATADPTSEWKLYKNEKYGFEIKIPEQPEKELNDNPCSESYQNLPHVSEDGNTYTIQPGEPCGYLFLLEIKSTNLASAIEYWKQENNEWLCNSNNSLCTHPVVFPENNEEFVEKATITATSLDNVSAIRVVKVPAGKWGYEELYAILNNYVYHLIYEPNSNINEFDIVKNILSTFKFTD